MSDVIELDFGSLKIHKILENQSMLISAIEQLDLNHLIFSHGYHLVHLLCERNNTIALSKLLQRSPERAKQAILSGVFTGWTPIHFAAANNSIGCLKILIERGARTSDLTKDGFSPYHLSIFHGAKQSIDYLKEYADTQQGVSGGGSYYFEGFSPIHIAAFSDHLELIIDDCSKNMCEKQVSGGYYAKSKPIEIAKKRNSYRAISLLNQKLGQ